jgi:hypothetical protein
MTRKSSVAATPPRYEEERQYRVVLCASARIGSDPLPVGRELTVSGRALNSIDPVAIRSAEPI